MPAEEHLPGLSPPPDRFRNALEGNYEVSLDEAADAPQNERGAPRHPTHLSRLAGEGSGTDLHPIASILHNTVSSGMMESLNTAGLMEQTDQRPDLPNRPGPAYPRTCLARVRASNVCGNHG